MNSNLTETEINTIAALGYRVYMSTNPHFQTYCFYSDGKRIGYLQREDFTGSLSIGTVHKPNRRTGTGFRVNDHAELTQNCLEQGFITAPGWADSQDRESVKKLNSLDEFLASHGSHTEMTAA